MSGLDRADDRRLPLPQQAFAYLPLEHAEDRASQRCSAASFEGLCAEVPPQQRPQVRGISGLCSTPL
ncbi:hypothetical protein B5P43_01385 [Bacillus sp. SRB_336]|nr:hypothetical protein B5P43_01385 [Bacillus sp. SRB_336]